MIFGQDRDELRRMYCDAWTSAKQGAALSPLSTQIVRVIEEHPEYQSFIENNSIGLEFLPEQGQSNPYLHMGLHLAVREQLATNRPAGIREVFEQLATMSGDPHAAEHAMLVCLAESLWDAQRNQALPDEALYLERLRQLRGRSFGGR